MYDPMLQILQSLSAVPGLLVLLALFLWVRETTHRYRRYRQSVRFLRESGGTLKKPGRGWGS